MQIIVDLDILENGNAVGHRIGDPVSLKAEVNKTTAIKSSLSPSCPQNRAQSANFDNRQMIAISDLTPYKNEWVTAKPL